MFVCVSRSVMSNSLWPHGLYSLPGSSIHGILQARMLGRSHSLLQEIFPTQGLNLGLLHCRQIFYHLSHQGKSYCNWYTFLNYLFIHFWLHWIFITAQTFPSFGELVLLYLWVTGFSCCRPETLGSWASVAVARGLSCSAACEIFLDWGSNPCPLNW